MNVVSATMDIAVDGLAIDILKERDYGYGNAIQVLYPLLLCLEDSRCRWIYISISLSLRSFLSVGCWLQSWDDTFGWDVIFYKRDINCVDSNWDLYIVHSFFSILFERKTALSFSSC